MSSPANCPLVGGRYELREVLGRGGMGVIYRAYDRTMRREVALKTLHDIRDRSSIDLFLKEWGVLTTIVHPNIIEIHDIGEFDDNGSTKPYFVMPLLPGATLDRLIDERSPRLTVERAVDIICQALRGLQVAHDRRIVHRDLKPSNIFVMDDDSVKLIDFGIARVADNRSTTSIKGTLVYMSPEQVQMKPPTGASDIFSMGVVTYETLTGRRPFEGKSESDVARAILQYIPPPASEINPSVSQALSRVVHKAMAKQPWHRFASAREFGETLQKALRNEPIEMFDPAKTQPRIEKAQRAFDRGDFQFAGEVLSELEGEGFLETRIGDLRRNLDRAVRGNKLRQLLDSARAYYSEQEYELALRKIQEALEIDPSDPEPLSLKNAIEKERRERKAVEWLQLARQHLANLSFQHARQAIQSLLALKPGDADAIELSAEVDRCEQEYRRFREQKDQFYQSAMDAWRRGEISAALSRLERLMDLEKRAPEPGTERSASIQTFYNQVRSEHDALRNGYEAARTALAQDEIQTALSICEEHLRKYPNHALFQALKFDIGARQGQLLSAFIAETDRKVETEPDLDRRLGILEEALRTYPGERHFETAVRLVREKRNLVASIVERARLHEEAGHFNEALDQWKILTTIHSQYPGLEFELERVRKRREQQVVAESKVRWVGELDVLLESGNYAKAITAAREALAEFPDDPELIELEKLAQQGSQRNREASELLSRAGAALAARNFDEAVDLLRQAGQRDPRHPAVRSMLADSFTEQARELLDSDWRAALQVVEQALAVDAGHAGARSLRELALDRQREDAVSACATQARRLQAAGDLKGALAEVHQGLSSYPADPRLKQLQNALQRAFQAEAAAPPPTETVVPTAPAVPPAQPEAAAPDSPATITLRGPAAPEPVAEFVPQPPPEPWLEPVPPPEAIPPAAVPPPPVAARPGPKPRLFIPLLVAAGVLITLGVLALAVFKFVKLPERASVAPTPITGTASFQTTPPGARILIDGKDRGVSGLELQMEPGKHFLEATLDGYQVETATFEVNPTTPITLNLKLNPLATSFRAVLDVDTPGILLDNKPQQLTPDGEIVVENMSEGGHTLRVASNQGSAVIPFRVAAGAAPALGEGFASVRLTTLLVFTLGRKATVYCSCAPSKAALDGQPAGEITAAGLPLDNLAPQVHEMIIGEGPAAPKFTFTMSAAPSLAALVKADRSVGSLLVVTGEDNVSVTVNDKPLARQTTRGQVRILNLGPGNYRVRVSKPGFQEEAPQQVQVTGGQQSTLTFAMRPVPQTGSLQIRGALAATEVFIDGQPAGSVQADGSFSATLKMGSHIIELRRASYKPRRLQKEFGPGQTLQLTAAEVALERAMGTLRLKIAPAGARVTIRERSEAEAQARPVTGEELSLPGGSYVVKVAAPKYVEHSAAVDVVAGESRTVDVSLREDPAAAERARHPILLPSWDNPSLWSGSGPVFVQRGGELVTFRPTALAGTITFTAELQNGRRLRWFLACRDERNYLLFEIDRRSFYRKQVADGKTTELEKTSHPDVANNRYVVRIDITPDSVGHQLLVGSTWHALDNWKDASRGFPNGKFGFLVQGRDQIGLVQFNHQTR